MKIRFPARVYKHTHAHICNLFVPPSRQLCQYRRRSCLMGTCNFCRYISSFCPQCECMCLLSTAAVYVTNPMSAVLCLVSKWHFQSISKRLQTTRHSNRFVIFPSRKGPTANEINCDWCHHIWWHFMNEYITIKITAQSFISAAIVNNKKVDESYSQVCSTLIYPLASWPKRYSKYINSMF